VLGREAPREMASHQTRCSWDENFHAAGV
jgi:hypothetical protein